MYLNNFRSIRHSQHGEDGIIAELLRILKIKDSVDCWAVEFGAWDGKYLSNTFAKVEDGWSAVYIEGDPEKYNDLLVTAEQYKNIVPVQAMVSRYPNNENSLEKLLSKTPLPLDFELLSIDIDTYDLDVWEYMELYSAKIVVIETNSGAHVINDPTWRHTEDENGNVIKGGSSLAATLDVAKKKGYKLAAFTGNAILVRNDL